METGQGHRNWADGSPAQRGFVDGSVDGLNMQIASGNATLATAIAQLEGWLKDIEAGTLSAGQQEACDSAGGTRADFIATIPLIIRRLISSNSN